MARAAVERACASRRLAAVFRYPVDVFPTAAILAVFAAQIAVVACARSPFQILAALVVLFPLQLNFAGMCHNHHHLSTFRRPWLNRAFEVVMWLQLGMLPYGYTLHHNIGHHRYYLDQTTDSNRWRRRDGRAMTSWEFALVLCLRMYPEVLRIGRRHPVLRRKFLRMAAVCALVHVALLVWAPLGAFLVFVLPLPFALLLQAQATYGQHAGLNGHDHLTASRSVVDRAYNLRTLNLGYHAAHHLRPGLHWSRLPAYHATIASRLPPDLVA